MTTRRPPWPRSSRAWSRARVRFSSSALTAMRMARKVRVAGWMRRRPPPTALCDGAGQLQGGAQRPLADDAPGDGTAVALLAVAPEEVGQLLLGVGVDDVCRREALLGAEAHVQGSLGLEAEAPRLIGQLQAGEAEVEQHAVDRGEAVGAADVGQVAEVAFDKNGGIAEGSQAGAGEAQGAGVGVNAEKEAAGRGGLQHGIGVAAGRYGAIDIEPPGLHGHGAQDLVHHHRCVAHGRRRDGVHRLLTPCVAGLPRPPSAAGFQISRHSPRPLTTTAPSSAALLAKLGGDQHAPLAVQLDVPGAGEALAAQAAALRRGHGFFGELRGEGVVPARLSTAPPGRGGPGRA